MEHRAKRDFAGVGSRRPHAPRSRWSRTLGVAGAICVVGVVAASLTGSHAGAEGSLGRLDEPGSALQTAERLSLRPPPVPDGMLMFPVSPGRDCYVLDNFGDGRDGQRLHEGVDIMGSAGAPVYAVVSGVLTKRYTNTGTAGWGWTLFGASTQITYKYFHLADDSVGLLEGDAVTAGQTIGYVGKSGTFGVDNFHLHFEIRPDRVAVNPLPRLLIDRSVCGVSRPIRA